MSLLRHTSDTLTWERKTGGNVYIISVHAPHHIYPLLANVQCSIPHQNDFFPTQYSLLDVLPEMSNLKVPTELRELPDDITLAQTVALWKYIVYYQSHQRQDY